MYIDYTFIYQPLAKAKISNNYWISCSLNIYIVIGIMLPMFCFYWILETCNSFNSEPQQISLKKEKIFSSHWRDKIKFSCQFVDVLNLKVACNILFHVNCYQKFTKILLLFIVGCNVFTLVGLFRDQDQIRGMITDYLNRSQ